MAKPELSLLQEAVKWAARLHRGQDRDGPYPLPYLTHPMDVLSLVRYKAGVTDEDILCTAALHDVMEMCGVDREDVEKRFGPRVASLVVELTRREPSLEETAGLSKDAVWQLRSDILLEEIRMMSPEARIVKLADRLSNVVEGLATRKGKRLERYRRQSFLILEIVPRETAPALWDGIRQALGE
jgi:guanosine-3',5'-bis(diphosphate) 3'-pyrophosphohydrolase